MKISEPQREALAVLSNQLTPLMPWDDQIRTFDALCRKGLAEYRSYNMITFERGGYMITDKGRAAL